MQLLETEIELVDDYVMDALPARERALFEARAAAVPALAERVEYARALLRREASVTDIPRPAKKSPWVAILLAASLVLASALALTVREATLLGGSVRALESSREALVAQLAAAQQASLDRQKKVDESIRDLASRDARAGGAAPILAFTLSEVLARGQRGRRRARNPGGRRGRRARHPARHCLSGPLRRTSRNGRGQGRRSPRWPHGPSRRWSAARHPAWQHAGPGRLT